MQVCKLRLTSLSLDTTEAVFNDTYVFYTPEDEARIHDYTIVAEKLEHETLPSGNGRMSVTGAKLTLR